MGEPWLYNYKHDVWTYVYEAFVMQSVPGLDEPVGPFYTDCTAFYEFIYPTYRPIFTTPWPGVPERSARKSRRWQRRSPAALRNEPLIQQLVATKQPFHLSIVAHSMGGLVARAGMNVLDPANEIDREVMNQSWDRLITWGTPHHGIGARDPTLSADRRHPVRPAAGARQRRLPDHPPPW